MSEPSTVIESVIDTTANKILSMIDIQPTKKSKVKIKPPPVELSPFNNAVLYTDGSAKPNGGTGGYGVHGYMYKTDAPKKGAGINATAYMYKDKDDKTKEVAHAQGSRMKVTDKGYQNALAKEEPDAAEAELYNAEEWTVTKDRLDDFNNSPTKVNITEVTPIKYVNIYGGFPINVSNNVAELAGVRSALTYAINNDLKHVSIYSDSEYAIKGASGYSQQWANNGWRKKDGSEIKNVEYFKDIYDLENLLKNKGSTVKFNWIKGHNGDLGNYSADVNADLAVTKSLQGQIEEVKIEVPADQYWIKKVDKNPLLYQTGLFILDNPTAIADDELFTIDNVKELNHYGKSATEATYCFLKIKDIDPAIITLRDRQQEVMLHSGAIVACDLNILFKTSTAMYLRDHGKYVLNQSNQRRFDLSLPDDYKVTVELNPPLKAERAIKVISTLKQIYEEVIVKKNIDDSISITDITDQLYTKKTKLGAGSVKTDYLELNDSIENGYHKLNITIKLPIKLGSSDNKLALITGTDLPDKNVLKKLEDQHVSVSIITLTDSPTAFRFFIYIKSDVGEAIVSAFHGNLRFI